MRDELNKPQLSSRADAEREAELTQLNGKLYTVEKAQFDKGARRWRAGRRAGSGDSDAVWERASLVHGRLREEPSAGREPQTP